MACVQEPECERLARGQVIAQMPCGRVGRLDNVVLVGFCEELAALSLGQRVEESANGDAENVCVVIGKPPV